jgi:hypothetical protein
MRNSQKLSIIAVVWVGFLSQVSGQVVLPKNDRAPRASMVVIVPLPDQDTCQSAIRTESWVEIAKNYAPIASSFISLAGLLSIWFAILNLRIANRALRARVSLDALQLLEGKDGRMRENRLLLDDLATRLKDDKELIDLRFKDTKTINQLHELARAYDTAGLLVKHGLIPISLLFDFYSRPIALAWKHLKSWVSEERARRKPTQARHLLKFEVLATGAALYRKNKEEKLLTAELSVPKPEYWFDIDEKIQEQWENWLKRAWKD